MQKHSKLLSTLALSLLSTAIYAAPVAPDAGQTSRELQKQPELAPAKPDPVILQPETGPAPPVASNGGERIAIKAIHVTGNRVFGADVLERVVAHWAGAGHTLADLDEAAASITAYYRQRGYLLAQAYLPEQEIADGILVISVIEGQIGQVNIDNRSRLSDKAGRKHLDRVQAGAALQAQQVDRAVLLLNDTPGVGGTRASLQPGASVGTTDLLIELDPAAPYQATAELDNYGNRYTGEYRAGGALALDSPLGIGDQLSVRALASDGGMSYVRLAYQAPVGGDGLRVGVAYADTRYKLGKEFAALQAHGVAGNASVYAAYPFIRGQQNNLSGTAMYESKKLADYTDAPASATDKKVQLINLGLSGNRRDTLHGAGMTSFDLSLVGGNLGMDAGSLATDAVSANSNGSYTKLGYSFSRLQRLTDKDTLSLAFSGQQANKNLNSSEKFSLGGAGGVRAYPQGEGSGDLGWMANVEVRHTLKDNLQALAFYDAGSVTINRTPYAAAENSRSIAGAGVGANARYRQLQFKTALAWRTGAGGGPQSEPEGVSRNPRLWVQVSAAF
ncbi:MAG: ShlB/FhaC/HecB family hemolysin secretion/activation protein [Gallionellaceae bacterium]|nr:MAG: ShlB/FhaC/HecB family hemolysin secretion/activation protein [Gallionellaceae bacterium]